MATTMQNSLMQTIEALAKEKGIEADMIITAIEDAVLTASRKYYKTNENLKTRFNPETGQVDLFAIVEQDLYPCERDVPFPIAKRTQQYLGACGLGPGHRRTAVITERRDT